MSIRGIISWDNPTTNVDGSAYNHATQGVGYELALNSEQPLLTLPFAFGNSFDMNSIEQYVALGYGTHTVRLRVVSRNGGTSAWASATFLKAPAPSAPANLAVD